MHKTKFLLPVFLFAFGALPVLCAPIDPATGANLLQQFLPQQVTAMRQKTDHNEHAFTLEKMTQWLSEEKQGEGPNEVSFIGPFWNYIEVPSPGDPRELVLLYWCEDSYLIWWRLVGRTGETPFALLQDGEGWYPMTGYSTAQIWFSDLDKDGTPEMLLCGGPRHEMTSLFVFQWQGGQLIRISPRVLNDVDGDPFSPDVVVSPFQLSVNGSGVFLEDLDGDGKAEIIVGPDKEAVVKRDPNGVEIDRIWKPISPTRIYHLVNGTYVFWKEGPADDPYPIAVPSIAVLNPSTLPLSELSNPGNGKLRVFVSHPAAASTVDDMESGQFKYGTVALNFKKRWSNQKQPDITSANWEWGGCPVKQAPKQGQGEWQVNPSDPALPSPDGAMEYHFVAPYLELELSRAAVFPYLLQAATDAFAKDPARQTYFVEVPLSGKMKNGKLAAVGAMVCIKKTESARTTRPQPAPQAPSPAPPHEKE